MSSNDHNISKEHASDTFVFTNSDREPVTCDKNPAHFDGFVLELSDCIERTGEFLAFTQQGVVINGHRTITDSIANIPFILGSVPNAIAYGSGNPCPPTAQRVASHNAAAAAAGTPLPKSAAKSLPKSAAKASPKVPAARLHVKAPSPS